MTSFFTNLTQAVHDQGHTVAQVANPLGAHAYVRHSRNTFDHIAMPHGVADNRAEVGPCAASARRRQAANDDDNNVWTVERCAWLHAALDQRNAAHRQSAPNHMPVEARPSQPRMHSTHLKGLLGELSAGDQAQVAFFTNIFPVC
jgi:hypothetical protein